MKILLLLLLCAPGCRSKDDTAVDTSTVGTTETHDSADTAARILECRSGRHSRPQTGV